MEDITSIQLVIYAMVAFAMSVLSGVAGGGAGAILTPLLIFFGLSPASAVSTGKLSGLALSLGSIDGLRKAKVRSKRLLVVVLLTSFVVGLLSALVIQHLDSEVYKNSLGIILLIAIPLVFVRKIGHISKKVTPVRKYTGFGLLTIVLSIQGVFSSGAGILVNFVMMDFLGLSALEASYLKSLSQIALNITIIVSILLSGLIIWDIAMVGFVFSLIGGYIGGHTAFRGGNAYVLRVVTLLMLISGVALILG